MNYTELCAKIKGLADADHDYNSSAEALVDGAEAVFNYLAAQLGVTGFQDDYASLKLLGRLRRYDETMPYGVLTAERMCYPQLSQPVDQALEWQEQWHQWAAEKCRVLLEAQKEKGLKEQEDKGLLSPRVRLWWENMAEDAERK